MTPLSISPYQWSSFNMWIWSWEVDLDHNKTKHQNLANLSRKKLNNWAAKYREKKRGKNISLIHKKARLETKYTFKVGISWAAKGKSNSLHLSSSYVSNLRSCVLLYSFPWHPTMLPNTTLLKAPRKSKNHMIQDSAFHYYIHSLGCPNQSPCLPGSPCIC